MLVAKALLAWRASPRAGIRQQKISVMNMTKRGVLGSRLTNIQSFKQRKDWIRKRAVASQSILDWNRLEGNRLEGKLRWRLTELMGN